MPNFQIYAHINVKSSTIQFPVSNSCFSGSEESLDLWIPRLLPNMLLVFQLCSAPSGHFPPHLFLHLFSWFEKKALKQSPWIPSHSMFWAPFLFIGFFRSIKRWNVVFPLKTTYPFEIRSRRSFSDAQNMVADDGILLVLIVAAGRVHHILLSYMRLLLYFMAYLQLNSLSNLFILKQNCLTKLAMPWYGKPKPVEFICGWLGHEIQVYISWFVMRPSMVSW